LPALDPNRIGIMGFSMGGATALLTFVESDRASWMGSEKGFAALVGFYPVCKVLLKRLESGDSQLTGAPMIVLYGTADSYGDGDAAPELKSLLAEKYKFDLITVEYPGASHGFNRNGRSMRYPDPGAKHGIGHMAYDPDATSDSIPKVVAFLSKNLAAK